MFWLDESLGSQIYLDGIVTLVDAKYALQQITATPSSDSSLNECVRQIALADRIVINKADLVSQHALAELQSHITGINAVAPSVATHKSRVPLDFLLDIQCYSSIDAVDIARFTSGPQHVIDTTVKTILIMFPAPLPSRTTIDEFAKEVLWESGMEVLRMKASFEIAGSPFKYVLQSVREMYDVIETQDTRKEEGWENKFVLIGRDLDRDFVERKLREVVEKTRVI